MNFKHVIHTAIKIILPLFFGLLLIWFLYRGVDFSTVWSIIKEGVRYDIILFSLVFGLMANIVRALRWGLLIESLGGRFKTSNIISDTIAVGLITFSIFIFNIGFFNRFFEKNPQLLEGIQSTFNSVWLYVGALIIVAAIWFVFKFMSHLSLVQKTKGILTNIWSGIKTVWIMKKKGLFLLETILIWSGYFFYFYITFYAFDFTKDLGISIGLIAFTMSSIGVAVPVQGGIGPWHFMVIATLVCFGVGKNDAAAFALVVHTIQTVWVIVCGLFGIVALPITNKKPEAKVLN